MTNGSQLTCGTCRHWHKLPPNPQDITDRRGECRESPPSTTSLPHGPQGGILKLCSYPILRHDFLACSRHSPVPIELETT